MQKKNYVKIDTTKGKKLFLRNLIQIACNVKIIKVYYTDLFLRKFFLRISNF
jgi:hypothetical protein